MIINVIVAEKNAIAMPHEALVCGNSDYIIDFDFDAEWDQHPTKTARFIFDDRSYTDVVFTGNQCQVPVLTNTHEVIVGVFAGNLTTTTPAYLRAQRSILCYGGDKTEFTPDQYDLIMSRINQIETIATGAAHSDWSQNSAVTPDYVKNRTHYDVTRMSVARGASVDADAPSARIYRSDGSEAAVRWVKVSDHVPDAEIFISAGTVITGESNWLKVSHKHIINLADNGYMIARDADSESTGRTLRIVYAVVCFEAGYKVLGYPSFEATVSTSTATLPEPGVYLPVTDSGQTTYYGYKLDAYVKPIDEKYIPDTIARKKDLENIVIEDPVTDEHINGLIDAKLAGLDGSYILPRTVLEYISDNYVIPGTWLMPPVVGNSYIVNYNGVEHRCKVIELPENFDTPAGMFVMGNVEAILPGITGNPDAPFVLVGFLELDGMAGAVMPLDGAESITLAISADGGASLPVPVDPTKTAYLRWNGTEWVASTIDQLKADLGLTVAVELSCDEDGDATITGAILTVDEEGNATLTGYTPSVDGDGDATIG